MIRATYSHLKTHLEDDSPGKPMETVKVIRKIEVPAVLMEASYEPPFVAEESSPGSLSSRVQPRRVPLFARIYTYFLKTSKSETKSKYMHATYY